MAHLTKLTLSILAVSALMTPLAAHANEPAMHSSIWNSVGETRLTQQQYFTTYDADRSGSLEQDEYADLTGKGHGHGAFEALDTNRDGKLSLSELEGNESQRMAVR
jgi:hypothetical protein